MGMDILLVTAPETVSKCLAESSAAGARALSEARRRTGVNKLEDAKLGGASGRGLRASAAAEADPNFVSMNSNPITAMSGAQQTLSAADVLEQTAPPDAMTWRAIRQTFAATDSRAKALAIELAQLRERVNEPGSSGASPSSPAAKGGKRNTFAPSTAGDQQQLLGGKVSAAKARKAAAAASPASPTAELM